MEEQFKHHEERIFFLQEQRKLRTLVFAVHYRSY